MIIDEINERTSEIYEGNKDLYSSFVLADYISYSFNEHELTEALLLENKNSNIEIDRDSLILTDILGNVMLKFADCDKYSYTISYVNIDNIIIKKQNKNQDLFEIIYYQYNRIDNTLSIISSFPRVKEFMMFPNEEKYLIRIGNKDNNWRLFSLKDNKLGEEKGNHSTKKLKKVKNYKL